MEKIRFDKLPQDVRSVLQQITLAADGKGVSVWLVGGMVRDLLLGRSSFDIDIVVEGDGVAFAGLLTKRLGGESLIHRRFGTVAIDLPNGLKVDVVTARRELYAHPGALPDVIFAQLSDDLFRRDFTINAVAASLNAVDLGVIRDDFDGVADLKKGLVRIMHYRSFVDDPTRIIRAVRYKKRFGFKLEARTLSALKTACHEDVFMTITPVRYFNEFKRILDEDDPSSALRRLRVLDGLRYFSFGQVEERLLDKIVRSQATVFSYQESWSDVRLLRLAGLLCFLDKPRVDQLMVLFNMPKSDKQKILEFLHFLRVPDMLGRLKTREFATSPKRRTA
ncbi:MAG: CCA tRNA nucleotidyltransferase [Candidatus Omnitrophica bacterium]|nr:CCA tRNA nucleotidyltransferase [Candidatus Omnitrophota bacterium]